MTQIIWNKNTGFRELIQGRSFWSSVIVEKTKRTNTIVKIYNKKKSQDGPRGAGVVLAALLNQYKLNNKFPINIAIKSKTGFKDITLPVFCCLSNITLRKKFLISFRNGKNIRTLPNKKHGWKNYEKYVLKKMKEEFSGFYKIKIKGITADGILQKKDDIIIFETKKKPIDFAEGLTQLIQYFTQLRNNPKYSRNKISCYLISPVSVNKATKSYKKGLQFLKSTIQPTFTIIQ